MDYDEPVTTTEYYKELLLDSLDMDNGNRDDSGDGIWETITTTTAPTTTSRVLGLYDIFIPLLGAFIIVFNLAVVVSSGLILKKGQQPRSTYLFLGNVGLTDLLTGFAVLFGQFYPRQYRDEVSCAIQIGMIVSATVTSVYSVGLIAIDRFLYILHGLQYQRWIYPNRARLLILITWIIGIVIGFLPAFGWRGDTENGRRCWFILVAPPELVLLTSIVGLLPILVVVVLYSIILHHALRKVIQLKRAARNYPGVGAVSGNLRMHVGSPSSSTSGPSTSTSSGGVARRGETNHKTSFDNNANGGGGALSARRILQVLIKTPPSSSAHDVTSSTNNGAGFPPPPPTPSRTNKSLSKWKAIKVVLFTTGSFVVTWVPYFIACCMYVNCDWSVEPARCRSIQIAIASPLAILGFANSLTNPIIYAWWHNGFRESAKAIFCGAACRKKRASESDGPSQSTGRTSASSGVPVRGHRTVSAEGNSQGANGTSTVATTGTTSGNNGTSFAVSTTTLNVSTTDVDLSDADGSSDVESALRRRENGKRGGGQQQQQQQQHGTPVNGSDATSVVNVCYQPDANGH